MYLKCLAVKQHAKLFPFKNKRKATFLGGTFLIASLTLLFLWGSGERSANAIGKTSRLQVARLSYSGATNPRPTALRRLLWSSHKRTSLNPLLKVATIQASDPTLYRYPLLYIGGDSAFPAWPKKDIVRLRSHLIAGGTLFIDMNSGEAKGPFDRSVRRLVKRLFPRSPLKKLPQKHTLFRSFYLLSRFGGRRLLSPYIEGVTRDERSLIIYSMNDHAGAWERDNFGNWSYPVIPGGFSQREHAFRFGVNLIMYALCVNYKQDAVHAETILNRRK